MCMSEYSLEYSDDFSVDDEPSRFFDLTINGRLFEAAISEYDGSRLMFSVGKGPNNDTWKGCVVITWDRNPRYSEAVLEWFGYNPNCSKDFDMERGNSKSMVIGSLLAFKQIIADYTHVTTLWLRDASSFKCPGGSIEISTMVASLFKTSKTYYQRLLNVSPLHSSRAPSRLQDVITSIKTVVDRRKGMKLIKKLAKKEWAPENEVILMTHYDNAVQTGLTWQQLVCNLMDAIGCSFLETCHEDLAKFFVITPLQNSMWEVSIESMPLNNRQVNYILTPMQKGGDRSARVSRIRKAAYNYRNSIV